MSRTEKYKRILPNIILAVVLLVTIFCAGANLTLLQDQAVNIKDDLANLEYINACTQRLVKLAVLDQDTEALIDFLTDENQRLLNAESLETLNTLGGDTLDEYIFQLLDSWEEVYRAINSQESGNDALFLASDNHFFKMSSLTTELNKLEAQVDGHIQQVEALMLIISVFGLIFSFYWFMDTRIERARTREIMEIATIDSATGLYNRGKCQELFERDYLSEKNSSSALGILVFDLNDLKITNDTKGHAMGDAMIRAFADTLVRAGESYSDKPFVGRYGGDEFVVFFPKVTEELQIPQFVDIMASLSQEFNKTEGEFQLSYAVGYAIQKKGFDISMKDLFNQADRAMYINKQQMKQKEVQILELGEQENSAMSSRSTTTLAIERDAQVARKQNKLFALGLCAVASMVIGLYVHYLYAELDYVGGNVLYLSTDDPEATMVEDILVPSPWKNASLSTMLLYRGLFQADSSLTNIRPDLAKSYHMSADGTVYTITMDSELYWSDGVALTAEDVVFSIESFLLCENVNVYLSAALQTITGYEEWRQGDSQHLAGLSWEGNVITMELDYPYSNFIQALAQFVPLPKHILSDLDPRTFVNDISYFHKPVCSGMFMVQVNDDFTLVQNPYYKGETPEIDTIVFLTDYSLLELDFYSTNSISEMVNYRSIRGFEEYPVTSYFYRYFIFNMGGIPGQASNPLEDVRVREAIGYAIDTTGLLDTIYFNTGDLIDSGIIETKTEDMFHEYNPEKARALLEEAEYDFDRPFTLLYYYNDTTSQIFMDEVKKQLEDVGFTVSLINASSPTSLYDARPYDMMLKGLSSFNYEGWYNEFSSTNPTMSKVFQTDAFDQLLLTLSTTTNERVYQQTLEDLKALEQETMYKLPLFTLKQGVYVNSNRLLVPENMEFGYSLFRYDLRFEEWSIRKQ